ELLVMPTMLPEARDHTNWLPAGAWFDVATGLVYAAGQPVPASTALEHLPMYARAGAIIPMQSPIEHTRQAPGEPLILDVWPFGESTGQLYEDDGATFAYRDGQFRRTKFRCRVDGDNIEVTMSAPEGGYQPPKRTPLVRLHGLPGEVERAHCAYAE